MRMELCLAILCGAGVLQAAGATQPEIVASTYLGGDGRDSAAAVAVDAEGNAYVIGDTAFGTLDTGGATLIEHLTPRPPLLPPGFPYTGGDAFLVKYAPGLSSAKFFALIGGTLEDRAVAITADPQGNTVILLNTESPDFPTRNAIQPALSGNSSLAVIKLSADGQQVIFSTYLGGEALPLGFSGRADVALDPAGQIYITGTTSSQNFPVTNGAFQPRPGTGTPDGFVTKLNPDGSLVYSTYLGGNGNDECRAMALGPDGSVFVGGQTTSTDFPLVNALNDSFGMAEGGGSPRTLFLAKLNPAGSALDFSTFLIGNGAINALAWTPRGNLVAAGVSKGGLTTTPNALLRSISGGFILELTPDLSAVAYCTHLGTDTEPLRLAVNATGDLAMTGTSSGPTRDAFAAKLDSARNLTYVGQIGGSNTDEGRGLAYLPSGDLLFVGNTSSGDFPVNRPLRPNPISDEGFVTQVTDGSVATNNPSANPEPVSLVPQSYSDRTSANMPHRFYRIREVPP